jgi:taurine dioxygenase
LRRTFSPEEKSELKALYRRHKLLVFRGQDLSLDQQREISSWFGPLANADRIYDVVSLDDGWLNTGKLVFHSDMAWVPEPPDGISLHAVDVEDGETYTAFVDASAAYRRLPTPLAERIIDLKVVSVTLGAAHNDSYPAFDATGDFTLERTLVRPHHATSEAILYIGRGAISRIVGMAEDESRALLDELFAYVYDSAFLLEHYWRNGDLVIWDNLALQHARPDLTGVTRRTLRRVTIARYDLASQLPVSFRQPAQIEDPAYGNR